MDPKFASVVEGLSPAFDRLITMVPITNGPPKGKPSGIYLFSEGNRHLYVGRAKDIRKRYDWHCLPHSDHNRASFAFKLARERTGLLRASHKGGEPRSTLMLLPEFAAAFQEAKFRIRRMNFRYVVEEHPTRQALLQAYATIALEAPYNDFNTH